MSRRQRACAARPAPGVPRGRSTDRAPRADDTLRAVEHASPLRPGNRPRSPRASHGASRGASSFGSDADSPMDRRALGLHSRPRAKRGRVRLLRLHGDLGARDGAEHVPGSSATDRSLMSVRPTIRASEAANSSASSDVVRGVRGHARDDRRQRPALPSDSPKRRRAAARAPQATEASEEPDASLDNRRGQNPWPGPEHHRRERQRETPSGSA